MEKHGFGIQICCKTRCALVSRDNIVDRRDAGCIRRFKQMEGAIIRGTKPENIVAKNESIMK